TQPPISRRGLHGSSRIRACLFPLPHRHRKLRTLSKGRLRTSWAKHRPLKALMEDLLAYRPTSLADEGLVPLSVLRLVNRMIVPPGKKQQQSEDHAGNQGEERQGSRRHSRRVRCDGVDVKD